MMIVNAMVMSRYGQPVWFYPFAVIDTVISVGQ